MIKRIINIVLKLWNSPTFTTWASFFSKAIYGIVLLPIVTTKLTKAEISIWLLLSVFAGLQMLGDLGFGATFSRAFSHAYGGASKILIHKSNNGAKKIEDIKSDEPNWSLIQKLYSTTSYLYFILSIILVIVIGIIGYFSLQIPVGSLLNKNEGWISFAIILIGVFISFNGSKYRLFLQGINKVALLQRNQAIVSTLTIIIASIVVLQTKSLIALIFIQQLGLIVLVILLRFLSKKYYVNKKTSNSTDNKIDINLIKSIFPIAWRSWIGILMSYGLAQVSGIIIAQYGNPGQTSSYLLSIKLLDTIKHFAKAPFYSKIPYMNQLFIRNDRLKLLKLAFQRMNISLLIQVIFTGIIMLFGNYILNTIGSNVYLVNKNILVILMVGYFFERYGALHIQLLSLSNNIIWHIANGVTGILFVIFSYLLLHLLSDPSLAFSIALLASYLCFYSWYSSYRSYGFYKMNFVKTEYQTTLKPAIVMVFIITINYFL